ncbi:MAG: TetR/AcrR family transcriptional regulator [Hyphomicrobium sp.]
MIVDEKRLPRVVKAPEVRRKELLAIARRLFMERGYDRVSVEDVIAEAGLSKGAFYYHFESKAALLEALTQEFAAESIAQVRDILDDPSLNAFERLVGFLERSRRLKAGQTPELLRVFEAIFRPENIALYHRAHAAVTTVMVPVMADIIQQGIEEETFAVTDARTTAEILLQIATITHDVVAGLFTAADGEDTRRAIEAFERRIVANGIAVDRILGLPDGSIAFIEPGLVEEMVTCRAAIRSEPAYIAG